MRRFVFGILNVGNSKIVNQEHCRTDATGMEFTSPLVCRGLTMSSCTLYGYIIFLRRECHSVCFLCEVSYDLKERMGRTDFTLFSYLYVSAGILIR